VTNSTRSLYAHVPFCASRCSYCDFHSSAQTPEAIEASANLWLGAIEVHLHRAERRFAAPGFCTVYLGGGTPSVLPGATLASTLQLLGNSARMDGCTVQEFTVEVNSEDIDDGLLGILDQEGVDRLSVGVQSLEDDARKVVYRRGSADSCMRSLETLSDCWSHRWSADLIYGLPGQTVKGLQNDVRYLASLGAGHISLYQLTLEQKAPLASMVRSGLVSLPDEEETEDLCFAASEMLVKEGMTRYEVSNWCIPGNECLHNQVYWEMGDWLALGPSGVSNFSMPDGSFLRIENSHDDQRYQEDPDGSAKEYTVMEKDAVFEYFMTSMRMKRGMNFQRFNARFHLDPVEVFGTLHERYPDLMMYDGYAWQPTDRGLDMLNVVLIEGLAGAESFFSTRTEG